MTPIVKVVTRTVSGFIFLYGCYIVLFGHISPGGGFAGGAIIAAGLILSRLAYGTTEKQEKNTSISSSIFESVGGLLFLAVALLGFVILGAQVVKTGEGTSLLKQGGYFFKNLFPSFGKSGNLVSAGSIPLANIAIGIKVGAAMLSIFVVLASTKYIFKE
jgi:multicomponent Na+:H+ antiporter subunit B